MKIINAGSDISDTSAITPVYANALTGHTIELLSYDLAYTVGAKLLIEASQTDNYWKISLQSKAGNILSSIKIDYSKFLDSVITNISLDYEAKKIVFIFKDGTTLDCDISVLITSLGNEIAVESTRAKAVEQSLQEVLSNEITRAVNVDNQLRQDLDEEQLRAKFEEEHINNDLSSKINEVAASMAGFHEEIKSESDRAKQQEAELSRLLEAERVERTISEQAITTKLETEELIRSNAVRNLQEAINIEKETRAEVDQQLSNQQSQLQSNINTVSRDSSEAIRNEANTRIIAINNLTNSLNDEIIRAKDKELTLSEDLYTEQITRESEDRALNARIDNLSTKGRFLSVWDCTDGYPETVPLTQDYDYHTGDYFIVGTVSESPEVSNYRPYGTSFKVGVRSTIIEPNTVQVNDSYVYDGTNWALISTAVKDYTFSMIVGDAKDNESLANYFIEEATAREEGLLQVEQTAKQFADKAEEKAKESAKNYAFEYTNEYTYPKVVIDEKDQLILTESKNYTYAASIIDSKDNIVLTESKTYTDNEIIKTKAYTDAEVAKAGKIDNVLVNSVSVVSDKTANIKLKTINSISVVGDGDIQIDPITDYNELTNVPILSADLLTFEYPIIGTYYKHIGETSTDYIKGAIYYCESTVPIIYNKITTIIDITNEAAIRAQADETLSNTKQNKLSAGTNIVIENDVISAISSTDYNDLANKPIINANLDADGFSPVLNAYYRHTGPSEIIITKPFVTGESIDAIYFDITSTPSKVTLAEILTSQYSTISAQIIHLTKSEESHLIVAAVGVINLEQVLSDSAYENEYAILADAGKGSWPIYATKAFESESYSISASAGWQNLPPDGKLSLGEDLPIDSVSTVEGWNGIWAYKKEVVKLHNTDTIYKCTNIEPIKYSSIDRLVAGTGIMIDPDTNIISCNILMSETKMIEEA